MTTLERARLRVDTGSGTQANVPAVAQPSNDDIITAMLAGSDVTRLQEVRIQPSDSMSRSHQTLSGTSL